MSYDLSKGLGDLGEDPAARPEVALDDTLTRLRRARARRSASIGLAGVAAVTALIVAVSTAVGLGRGEVQPADPTPTMPTEEPSETPEPTPSATTPVAAWGPRWDWCGGIVTEDAFSAHTGESGGFFLDSGEDRVSTDPAAPFTLSASLISTAGHDQVVGARVTEVAAAVLGEEMLWTVVGVESAPIEQEVRGTVPAAGALDVLAETRLVSCEANPLAGGSGTLDTPVPDGDYWLLATVEVTTAAGETYTVFAPAGMLGEPPAQAAVDGPPQGWPPTATDVKHGGETWGVYTVVLEAGGSADDPRWQEGTRRLGELGYPTGGGEIGCDVGAAEVLGVADGAMAVATYFDTQADAELFAQRYTERYGEEVVGIARVTTLCMD